MRILIKLLKGSESATERQTENAEPVPPKAVKA
jgi:hypothetical protein